MVRELVVGVAMLGADNASGPRVASRRAVRFDFDAMSQASRNIPSRIDTHRVRGASGNAASRGASRTRIEAERLARGIELLVDKQCGTKCDPRTVHGMHRDAEDARAGDTRDFAELDEVQGATAVHERAHK